jgi:hypothetical protein
VLGIAHQIRLIDGTGGEVGGIRWQRPVGKFIKFALDLNSEVEISVSPDAA